MGDPKARTARNACRGAGARAQTRTGIRSGSRAKDMVIRCDGREDKDKRFDKVVAESLLLVVGVRCGKPVVRCGETLRRPGRGAGHVTWR